MKTTWTITAAAILALALASCGTDESWYQGTSGTDETVDETSFGLSAYEENGFLAFMNDQQETTFERLDLDCALRSDSARNIIDARDGLDRVPGTADDHIFRSTQEIDAVHMVGPWTMGRLYECAVVFGTISLDKAGLVNFMNDQAGTTFERLDVDCAIRSDSARNLVAHRDGSDGAAGTADDDLFDTPEEIDEVSMVGPVTMDALTGCARTFGFVGAAPSFEPQQEEEEETLETVSDLSALPADLVAVIDSLIAQAYELYADHDIIFPVEFSRVEITYSGPTPVRYHVYLFQKIDPEYGIKLFIEYWLNADLTVDDVSVYI